MPQEITKLGAVLGAFPGAAQLMLVLALAAFGAAGCEEDDDQETQAPPAAFAYVSNSSNITGFVLDEELGTLTEMPDSPFPSSTTGSLAVSADQSAMVVYTGFALITKRIDLATGRLITVPGGGLNVGMSTAMAMDSVHDYVFVTDNMGSQTRRYGLGEEDAKLTSLGAGFAYGASPNGIAVDPLGRFVYVTQFGSTQISGAEITASSGQLTATPNPNISSGGTGPIALAVDAQGEFIAVINQSAPNVAMFSIQADGDLTDLFETAAIGTSGNSIAFHPSGELLYLTDIAGVRGFSVDRSDGSLTAVPGSPFAAGITPRHVAFSPSGSHLLVADQTDSIVQVFEIAADGSLTEAAGSPYDTGTGSSFVLVLDPVAP